MKVRVLFEFNEEDRRSLPLVMKGYDGTELMSYSQMKEWVVNLVESRCDWAKKRAASIQTQLVFQDLKERASKAKELAGTAKTPQEVMQALKAVEDALQELNEVGDTEAVRELNGVMAEGWDDDDLLEEEEEEEGEEAEGTE